MSYPDDVSTGSRERQRRVLEILDGAIELPRRGRRAFLDRACGDDSSVRRDVEALLNAGEDSDFLTPPLQGSVGESVESRIGPYQLIHLLGRGGMGEVYLAEHRDLEKRVALKLIRRGLDNAEIVRRFNSERQILAQLDHPNIARVLDGGTTDGGRPYLVMEYVEGESLDVYCSRKRLSVRRRLELFVKICSAVELSHQRLVVHRDLKPGNILVTPEGEPKLLDFGIAKLLQPSLAADPVTSLGQRPMTLRYASPEQAGGERVDTTSDIYSLGVLLYELLSGHGPYKLQDLDRPQAIRLIREQEPEKLSIAAGRASSEPVSPSEERERRRLRRRLAGDLDSIVGKALRKEPQDRYSSVQQLAEDIRRHLQGKPVTARPDAFTYTAGKFIRRNRLAVAVTVGIVLLSSSFGVVATTLWRQAVGDRQRAEMALQFLEDMIKAAEPDQAQGEPPTVVDLLDIGKERISRDLASEPGLQIDVADTLGVVFRQLGEYKKAQEMMEYALRIAREHRPRGHPEVVQGLANLAVLLYDRGDYPAAERYFRDALTLGRRIRMNESTLLTITGNLASTLMLQGQFEPAEKLYREVLADRERRFAPDSPQVASSKGSLGILHHAQGDLERAEPLLREALAIRQRVYGSGDTRLAPYLDVLGRVLAAGGRFEAAEPLYSQALAIRQRRLPSEHPHLAQTQKNLAGLLISSDPATAQVLLSRALTTLYKTNPVGWQAAEAESLLGAYLTSLDRYEEAEPCLVESYRTLREIRGEQAIYTRSALNRLLALDEALGRPDRLAEYR